MRREAEVAQGSFPPRTDTPKMVRTLRLSFLGEEPMKPAEADFGVTVDFAKGASDPVKVFESISILLDGFRKLDQVTIGALDAQVEPIMVLEDVEASSITAWVRNRIRQIDDQALKELDWKQQIGVYARRAKYRVLEYLDQRVAADEAARLTQLKDDLSKLAGEPQFRHLPLPMAIPLEKLVAPLDRIQEAKGLLSEADRLIVRTEDREHVVNLSETKKPSDYVPDSVASTSRGEMPMTLLVRKPDYLGDTLWEFRHGEQTIEAHVRDAEWLARFRAGKEVISPGGALSCIVAYEYGYDEKGKLKVQRHQVTKVLGVINQVWRQAGLPGT